MKTIFFSVLMFISGICAAQQFKGVVMNDTTYYLSKNVNPFNQGENDSNLIRAIWIESLQANGSDTFFQFFRSIRPTFPLSTCLDTSNSPSWMGPGVLRNLSGDEHYYNYRNEEILIKTLAALNSTWKITTDTNNIEIWGTITQIVNETIDSQMDSVKYISLQAYQNSIPITHNYNGHIFKLSQHHGFVSVHEWYSFPYPFVENNVVPIDTSLHNRINRSVTEKNLTHIDFTTMYQPGTFWQTKTLNRYSSSYSKTTWAQDSITAMQLIATDTAEIKFQHIEVVKLHDMIEPPSAQYPTGLYLDSTYTLQYAYTDTIFNKNHDNTSIRKMKYGEHLATLLTNAQGSLLRTYRQCLKKYTPQMMAIETSMNWLLWTVIPATGNCYEENQGVSGNKKYHLSYLPQLNYYPGDYYSFNVNGIVENDDSTIVIYYKDQQQTYGTPVNVSTLSTTQLQQANSISIYPNPSQDGIFQIELKEKMKWNVFSMDGKLIASGSQQQVNLSCSKQGIYLLTIQSESGNYHSKILIE